MQIEALDITVLKGDGREVLAWCAQNGFTLDVETRDHLLGYAEGSPIFMAAKYDTSRAQARGQLEGDGAPVLITMPTKHIWVPLEVLALEGQQVQADLYLLTDMPVNTSSVASVLGQSPVGTADPRRARLHRRLPRAHERLALPRPLDGPQHGLGPPRRLAHLPPARRAPRPP